MNPGRVARSGDDATGPKSPKGCRTADVLKPADGGADRDRTGDLRLARAALSQLSYSPDRLPPPAERPEEWWA